jgi:hypothetical protein
MVAVAESRDGEGVGRRGRRGRTGACGTWCLDDDDGDGDEKRTRIPSNCAAWLHGIGLLGSENEGGAAPEKTVTSLGRKGVLDLAKVNARLG